MAFPSPVECIYSTGEVGGGYNLFTGFLGECKLSLRNQQVTFSLNEKSQALVSIKLYLQYHTDLFLNAAYA